MKPGVLGPAVCMGLVVLLVGVWFLHLPLWLAAIAGVLAVPGMMWAEHQSDMRERRR